jgi:hypothetical protein
MVEPSYFCVTPENVGRQSRFGANASNVPPARWSARANAAYAGDRIGSAVVFDAERRCLTTARLRD